MGLFPSRSTKPFEIPKEIKTKENNKKIKSLFVVFSLNNDWKLNWRAPFFLYKKRRERCWRFSHSSLSKSSEFRHKMGKKKKEKVGKGGNGSVGFFLSKKYQRQLAVSVDSVSLIHFRGAPFFSLLFCRLSQNRRTHINTPFNLSVSNCIPSRKSLIVAAAFLLKREMQSKREMRLLFYSAAYAIARIKLINKGDSQYGSLWKKNGNTQGFPLPSLRCAGSRVKSNQWK